MSWIQDGGPNDYIGATHACAGPNCPGKEHKQSKKVRFHQEDEPGYEAHIFGCVCLDCNSYPEDKIADNE